MAGGILSPHLLSWQQGGVDFLLADSDLPPEFSLCHAVPRQAEARPAPRSQGAGMPPQRAGVRPPVQQGAQSPMSQGAHASVPQGAQAPRYAGSTRPATPARPTPHGGQAAPSATPAAPTAVTSLSSGPPLAPELWPRPWRERLKATRPAPVVWTYWALGEDLCGQPNAQRRDLLKRLLGDLQHPGGTHSFWPAALPSPQDWEQFIAGATGSTSTAGAAGPESGPESSPQAVALHAHVEAFWSGVELLKARALVVMGSPAVKALDLPPGLRPFQQIRHRGKLVVVLRDMDVLVEEPHHYDAVREFLRRALEPFGQRGL